MRGRRYSRLPSANILSARARAWVTSGLRNRAERRIQMKGHRFAKSPLFYWVAVAAILCAGAGCSAPDDDERARLVHYR